MIRLALTALLISSAPALAHDWYVGKRDPVKNMSCCTTSANSSWGDCGKMTVTATNFSAEEGGYRVNLSHAEAVQINPQAVGPVNVFVPFERVQESGDGNFHICFGPTGTLYCFFMPPNG